MTYLEFSAKEVKEARDAAAHGDDLGGTGGQSSELSRMLRGGALDVKVRPVWLWLIGAAVPLQPSWDPTLTCGFIIHHLTYCPDADAQRKWQE